MRRHPQPARDAKRLKNDPDRSRPDLDHRLMTNLSETFVFPWTISGWGGPVGSTHDGGSQANRSRDPRMGAPAARHRGDLPARSRAARDLRRARPALPAVRLGRAPGRARAAARDARCRRGRGDLAADRRLVPRCRGAGRLRRALDHEAAGARLVAARRTPGGCPAASGPASPRSRRRSSRSASSSTATAASTATPTPPTTCAARSRTGAAARTDDRPTRIAGRLRPWDIVPASRAIGAVVARFVHTEEVTGSNPVSPTESKPPLTCGNAGSGAVSIWSACPLRVHQRSISGR